MTFFRLFWAAPRISRNFPLPFRRCCGHLHLPLAAEVLAGQGLLALFNVLGRPGKHHFAPVDARPGADVHQDSPPPAWCPRRAPPRSPCCPDPASFSGCSISLWLSRWCRPMEGSSRIYSTPIREEPIWVARRIRWLSPPDRVPEARDKVRYSSPTLCRKPSRDLISFKMWRGDHLFPVGQLQGVR